MKKIANRKVICECLVEAAQNDDAICIAVSDSRGSASLSEFAEKYPKRTIELGIAEQNLVGVAAGLAHSGKKPFVASPASFLTMRSIEQIKIDVAYSNTNVKLIGISAGVSYGALGMSHHSLQDLAVLNAIPNLRILVPADGYETRKMINEIINDDIPTYIRVGRNPVEQVHDNKDFNLEIGKALMMRSGSDLTIVATGEMVSVAMDCARKLETIGIDTRVLNIHTIKPFDEMSVINAAKETKAIITMEEHSINGGLGSLVASVISQHCPVKMKILGILDEITMSGNSEELFNYYGLNVDNVILEAKKLLEL